MIYKSIPSFHFNIGSLKNPLTLLAFNFFAKEKVSFIDYSSLRAAVIKK